MDEPRLIHTKLRSMIRVEQLSDEAWLVTVESNSTTKHLVRLTNADLKKFGGADVDAEKLLEASFRFLLEREPNTSILPAFELPLISRYFRNTKARSKIISRRNSLAFAGHHHDALWRFEERRIERQVRIVRR